MIGGCDVPGGLHRSLGRALCQRRVFWHQSGRRPWRRETSVTRSAGGGTGGANCVRRCIDPHHHSRGKGPWEQSNFAPVHQTSNLHQKPLKKPAGEAGVLALLSGSRACSHLVRSGSPSGLRGLAGGMPRQRNLVTDVVSAQMPAPH
jgi:hypothetical protein